MMIRTYVYGMLAAAMLLGALPIRAQRIETERDSSFVDSSPLRFGMQVLVPVAALDFAFFRHDGEVLAMRRHYVPNFPLRIDDYTAVLPLATSWGMSLAGVQGRYQKLHETATAQAIALLLCSGVVHGTKAVVGRVRPDGRSKTSFPSGHTALAFASAAILDAEYGVHYPWLARLGYASATFTGLSRILADRHYATDVLTGAGVGLASAYLGYLFTDLIYGKERSSGGDWLCALDAASEGGSPMLLSFTRSWSSLLGPLSDFSPKGAGLSASLAARYPLYKRWGLRADLALHHREGHGQESEYLDAYTVGGGLSYMYPLREGRLWLEGFGALGALSEARLAFRGKPEARPVAAPFSAHAPFLRIGVASHLVMRRHFAAKAEASYLTAPTARPYDRTQKAGHGGFAIGIGLSFVLDSAPSLTGK